MMISRFLFFSFFVVIVLCCWSASPGAPAERGGTFSASRFEVQHSTAAELIVTLRPVSYGKRPEVIDGKQMRRLSSSLSGWTEEPGKPELPAEGFLVAVPPGATPVLDILESRYDLTQVPEGIAPAPAYSFNDEGEAEPSYHLDTTFYETHAQFFPASIVEIGEEAHLRDLRVVKVIVHPVQYNPATGETREYRHLKVRVRFTQDFRAASQLGWRSISAPDPYFEPLYNDLVLNYKEAESWRGVEEAGIASLASDSSASWFQTGRQYFRIPVITDGIYRLTYHTLLGYGIDLAALNNTTAALYYKGASLPIRIETSDPAAENWFIEFYGHRNYGSSSYFDRYNDTSAYWLTWNDPAPRRMVTDSVSLESIIPDTAQWYTETLTQETDANYFFGVTQDDIQNTEDVAGEGWYWSDFVSGNTRNYSFTIDTVQRKTGTSVEIRARLHGMTTCTGGACKPPSRHTALFFLNGVAIGETNWTQNTETLFSVLIADSLLRSKTNTLQIRSKAWGAADSNISKFYLDWFTVRYPRPLYTSTGKLSFTASSAGSSSTTSSFLISGIPVEQAAVYDVTNGRRVTSLQGLSPLTWLLVDTLGTARGYVVVHDTSKLTPVRMEETAFGNLRANARGADYLVITHAEFRPEAERLARQRAAIGRLRTAVVDVQEIYNEFNYGHMDARAIRSFLRQAYYFWKRPSPVYAVFFGDASWDYKRNLTTSVKRSFVPSYGNPPSDNALVSFDSVKNFIPFMLTGRLPVENAQQAARLVDKLIAYDTPPVSQWMKSFLFITAGNTLSEKTTFNYWSDDLASRYVTRAPLGGKVSKVYKTSEAIIDGENRQILQAHINSGLSFVNFIGHSGGRVWGMNVGNPSDLLNTDGRLPFVSSVSCNVGFFSDPRSNVLSEDFLMADNRGAIAVWAGSSIGYGSIGRALVDKFLSVAIQAEGRSLGLLTSIARLNYWIVNNSTTPLVKQTLQLHPLIGDPFTLLALPTRPDFDVAPGQFILTTPSPTSDSTVSLKFNVRNLGLMPGTPILVSLTDSYTDLAGSFKGESDIVPPFTIDDFISEDSVVVPWNVSGKPGSHAVTLRIDPAGTITEVREDNNEARQTFYIYRSTLDIISPAPFSVEHSATPRLVVSRPLANDTAAYLYYFEVDTAADFSTAGRITSPAIPSGPVSASWQTPVLVPGAVHYWRARADEGTRQGAWISSSFSVAASGVSSDTVEWKQSTPGQLRTGTFLKTSGTGDGVALIPNDTTVLYTRSVGNRHNQVLEYYSTQKINDVVAIGYWWETAYSYLGARYDPRDGSYRTRGFDLLKAGVVDSMIAFIDQTPQGAYLMFSAVLNAKQNATETLYQRLESLGSTSIRQVTPGQSWILVSRKGEGTAIVEDYKPTGIAEAELRVANLYTSGAGSLTSTLIGPVSRWVAASWDVETPLNTAASLRILGVRSSASVDTLSTLPGGTASADLSFVDAAVYPRIQLQAFLSNTDGSATPLLKNWSVQYVAPPDLAVSPFSLRNLPDTLRSHDTLTTTLDVYNLGSAAAASARVLCFLAGDSTKRFDSTIAALAPGTLRAVDVHIPLAGAVGEQALIVRVEPLAGVNDLLPANNAFTHRFTIAGQRVLLSKLRILFDGIELHDGAYVSPTPLISMEYPRDAAGVSSPSLRLLLDGKEIGRTVPAMGKEQPVFTNNLSTLAVREALGDGDHTLEIVEEGEGNSHGITIHFHVQARAAILHASNYPNPFRGQTVFTFTLTGSELPRELRIKIFTVAGRLVRDLAIDAGRLQLGAQRIPWDGRDAEGDEIANGYYLYKIVMSTGTESVETIQKLVRLR